jgi:hypothetical protein
VITDYTIGMEKKLYDEVHSSIDANDTTKNEDHCNYYSMSIGCCYYDNNNDDNKSNEYNPSKTMKASIVDCCAFPFLYRLEQEFQLFNAPVATTSTGTGNSNHKYPILTKWIQQWEVNDTFQKTITNQWWWWWK